MDQKKRFFFEAATWPAKNTYLFLGDISTRLRGGHIADKLSREVPLKDFNQAIADVKKGQKDGDSELTAFSAAWAARAIGRIAEKGLIEPHRVNDLISQLDEIMPGAGSAVPLPPTEPSQLKSQPNIFKPDQF